MNSTTSEVCLNNKVFLNTFLEFAVLIHTTGPNTNQESNLLSSHDLTGKIEKNYAFHCGNRGKLQLSLYGN